MDMDLRDRIRRRLDVTGMKMGKASRAAGLGHTYVRDLLTGKVSNPRSEHLAKLAEVLGTTLEWLAEGRGAEQPGAGVQDASQVLRIWDRIAPEDRGHALRLLGGFVRERANASEASVGKKRRTPKG